MNAGTGCVLPASLHLVIPSVVDSRVNVPSRGQSVLVYMLSELAPKTNILSPSGEKMTSLGKVSSSLTSKDGESYTASDTSPTLASVISRSGDLVSVYRDCLTCS